nr:GcrA family cell cycle regulator [uncultured Lichenicoccus sp.]
MPGWTCDADRRLRDLWEQGLTTVRIAEAMGTSKNAVIGRAHRLQLVGRASPIKPKAVPPPVVAKPLPHGADLTGRRFGTRVVLARAEKAPGSKHASWITRCGCGRTNTVQAYALRCSEMCGVCSRAANVPVNPRSQPRAAPTEPEISVPIPVETNVVQLLVPERWFVTRQTAHAPRFQLKPKAALTQVGPGPAPSCQYPLTNGRPWRFCSKPSVPGKSWCLACCGRVYVQKRQSSEAAA